MKRFATASIILLFVIAIALPVFGYGFGQGRGSDMMKGGFDGRGNGGHCYDNSTNLTAEQSKELKALRDKHLEEITPLRNELFAKHSELRLLWNKETPDRNQIKAKEGEIDTFQDQLRDKMTDYRLDADKLVPSDQRQGSRGGYARRGNMGNNNYRHGGIGMDGMRR